jgi:hypothetical protein
VRRPVATVVLLVAERIKLVEKATAELRAAKKELNWAGATGLTGSDYNLLGSLLGSALASSCSCSRSSARERGRFAAITGSASR